MNKPSETVLVTGGRGFLGRAVVKLLQREGYLVLSVDHVARALPSTGSGQALPAGSDHSIDLQCDITDSAALESIFEKYPVETIMHLAAVLPTVAQREPLRATQVNVEGSLNLHEMARRFHVRRFVFGSSVSIYGSCPMDRTISERDHAAPEDLYGAAKLYVEQMGQSYSDNYGVEFVSLRIARVIGPGANSKTSAWRSDIFELINTKSVREIRIPYAASERILVVHVDDVARMLVTLLTAEKPAHRIYNAPCESMTAGDLKRSIEAMNANVRIALGGEDVVGNPRRLDCSRFSSEFNWETVPVLDRLAGVAGSDRR